jgi:hypothetical protein
MINKNNNNETDYKSIVNSKEQIIINQIDTIGPLLAEIFKIVQRIEKRQEEFSNTLSGMKYGY